MLSVSLPIRTYNPMNTRRHWRVLWGRAKRERGTASMLVRNALVRNGVRAPAVIRIVRQSAGVLDTDNLASSLKSVRDGVADAFGVDDSAKSPLRFEYSQELCRRGAFGVRIEITEVEHAVA